MSKLLKVLAPYDNHLIAEVPVISWDEIDVILETAHSLFLDRSKWLSKYERIQILKTFRILLSADIEKLASQAAEEGGKPLVDSLIEVNRAVNGVEIAIQELGQLKGTEIPMGLNPASDGHMAYTMHEPVGVVVALSAFNHPVNLIIHQVIPAIAAGCPVIVKPASATPLSCLSVVDLLYRAGLPVQWCQAILCGNEDSSRLASDKRIAFLTFIGSAKVGWQLRSNLPAGASCALEHGGVAPVIVAPDADIDAALPGIVKGGYYHAGQVCVSVQRLYVHKDMVEQVKDKMLPMVQALKTGDPLDKATEVGPLIKPSEADRVEQWVSEAVQEGAVLLCGGRRLSDTSYEPTLLLNPSEKSKVSSSEVFGPVVCIYEYDNLNEAIERANALPFSFQAAVYTESLNTAFDCVKRLKAKAVMVNEHTAFRVDWMPFGGTENSGLGMGGIGNSIRDMSSEKLMVIKVR